MCLFLLQKTRYHKLYKDIVTIYFSCILFHLDLYIILVSLRPFYLLSLLFKQLFSYFYMQRTHQKGQRNVSSREMTHNLRLSVNPCNVIPHFSKSGNGIPISDNPGNVTHVYFRHLYQI